MPPPFSELIDQISERSAVLRTAVATTNDVTIAVPGCPEWTLRDLVVHVGHVQRSWAAKVRAGAAGAAAVDDVPEGDLLAWSEESTDVLTRALGDVGPDAVCWTWWEESDAPSNAGAVARHQVQEAALHAYDAQRAVGQPESLPSDIAIDCVDEFLVVSLGAMGRWPHPPIGIGFIAAEGPRWSVRLTSVAKVTEGLDDLAGIITAPSSDLILGLYSRVPLSALQIEGDGAAVAQLLDWASESTG